QGLHERASRGQPLPHVIVCPPFVSLVPLRAMLDERLLHLGAQNCHWEQEGPHTGEIVRRIVLLQAEWDGAGPVDRLISFRAGCCSRACGVHGE
ncbi:MAG: triose-phosphate isomerase, partial [Pseudonocardiales bacterium]|nr:triose-phosphate isomerase [Pseudonocardiales bacterium]